MKGLMHVPLKLLKRQNGWYASYISLFFIRKLFKHTWKKENRGNSTINPICPSSRFHNYQDFNTFLHFLSFSLCLSLLVHFKAIPRVHKILPLEAVFEYWVAENFPKPIKDTIHRDSKISTILKQDKQKEIHIWTFCTEVTEDKDKDKPWKATQGLHNFLKAI